MASPVVPEARPRGRERSGSGKSRWIGKFPVLERVRGKGRAGRQAVSSVAVVAPQAWLRISVV